MTRAVELRRVRVTSSTQTLLPITSIENDMVGLNDGSLRAVLECPTLAFSLRDEPEQRALAYGWASLLNSLVHPLQIAIQLRRAAPGAGCSAEETGQRGRLLQSRSELLGRLADDRQLVDRRVLMVVPTERPTGTQKPILRLLGASAPRPVAKVGASPDAGVLEHRVRWVSEQLTRIGVVPRRLSTDDLAALFYRSLCPAESELQPLAEQGSGQPGWPGNVAPALFSERPAEVRLGGRLARVLAASAYPQLLRPAWLESLFAYDGDLDLSLHIAPVPSRSMMAFLNRRVAELSSTVRIAEEAGKIPDAYRRAALVDAADLQDRLARGEERLFEVSLYAAVWGEDEATLEQATKKVEAILGSILVQSRRLLFRMEPGFMSTLPLGTDQLRFFRILTTGVLAATFPFSGNDLHSKAGLLYGINPDANDAVVLDRFELHNHNAVVFATSGAGKSFLVKVELIRAWLEGTRIIVVDPEGEYAPVVEALDGQVVRIGRGQPVGLDPFAVADGGAGALSGRVASLLTLIELLADGMNANQRAAAEDALTFAYAAKGFTEDLCPGDAQPPTLADVRQALVTRASRWRGEARIELEQLAMRLGRYIEGSGRWLFAPGAGSVITADVPLGYLMEGLPEEDRAVAMFMVLDRIWAQLADNNRPTLVVVDEAWWLMQYPDTARFLRRLAKTARKRHAGLTLITQDVGDVLNSPSGEGIVTNAALQVLMRQAPQTIRQLAELFHLTEAEQTWLLNAQRGEGLLLAMGRRVPFRVVATDEEMAIIEGLTDDGGRAA
jgi:TraG P-loop domain/Helicase HerA, central domain